MENSLVQLHGHGQSYWIDDLTRNMLRTGELQRQVEEQNLCGVTSNPSIFGKAIAQGREYEEQIRHATEAGCSVNETYEQIVTADVRAACDILLPVFERTAGADGFVSLEVSPHLAHDTQGSIQEARRLHAMVARPNLLIKIPGTAAGVPAVEQLVFEGVNVNITLLFAVENYEAVALAYLRALKRRLEAGLTLDTVASVASFFLSRIDMLVDQLLAQRILAADARRTETGPACLLGKAAIANAKFAYQSFRRIVDSDEWKALASNGARPQRMLWASTSTKNPAYRDVMYVEPLIGLYTVNTMPEETIAAFLDHGKVADTVEIGVDEARQVLRNIEMSGISFRQVTQQLENEGVQKFIDAYDGLLQTLAGKREKYLHAQGSAPLEEMARKLRRLVIRMTTQAGSGHPTSCLSCADIVSALFFREMRWDPRDPKARNVDTFLLSKGHAAPILWAALHEAGAIGEDPMSLRSIDSTLEGHPTPNNPWVKVATGSLGQGLSAGNGIALANRLDGIDARVYCLLGDGECSEGSVWEAAQFASLHKLSSLVAIVDVNGLGQSGPAPYAHDTSVLARRFQSFGWKTIEIDGHDMADILYALQRARDGGPTAIVARTEKGKGVSFLESAAGWHGKPLDAGQMKAALEELGEAHIRLEVESRRTGPFEAPEGSVAPRIQLGYNKGEMVATRDGYGRALLKLGALHPEIVVLDSEVRESTRAKEFADAYPERFFECYIAEQNMVGAALGLAVSGKLPFASTFACFLTRAFDFIRMAGHSRPPGLVFCGSHAGVSIGQDGPSQMGLEDLAMFRAVHGTTILYPCDAVSAERVTEEAAGTPGIVYLRTTRGKTAVIYDNDERFPVGGSKTLRTSPQDAFTLIAAGITVHEALAAHRELSDMGIVTRVIDAYSVKPLDIDVLAKASRETAALIVVEDHWIDGGLGDAVAAAVPHAPVHRLAIRDEPRSGSEDELLERYGISRAAIVNKVLALAGR
ncbi:hypothetical protein SKTS_16270 [Sulfurimicrobium lacus]|uniref:Transaldolase n=1 Tax=Sulfurimicrobium lacus TaxID=2715678 RepID=A0A6F8VC73_9PROT|nr:transketolase [Sulfurimicrobium lacus]BCB26741.1 hypothetical protein SKTS_16270 [Sulfurimicrobium lacus]